MRLSYIKKICIPILAASMLAVPFFAHAADNPPSSLGGGVGDVIGGIALSPITFTLRVLLYAFTYVEGVLIFLTGTLVSFALKFNIDMLNFDPSMPHLFIVTGWQIFRDITNLGFVLGIVVIAIMTIFRYKDYQAKKILWKLIVAALVVNFSLLIGSVFIKVSNSVSCFMLSYIGNDTSVGCPGGITAAAKLGDVFRFWDIVNSMSAIQTFSPITFSFSGELATLAALATINIFGAIMFLVLISFAVMLFLRYFHLAFLLMVSPVAWLMWIFPATKKYFKEWWTNFIQWVTFAPVMLLFMYIALLVLDKHADGISSMAAADNLGAVDINFGMLMTSLFATGILIGGLLMAKKLGHGGTALALGAVDSGQKYAKKWAIDRAKRTGAAAAQGAAKGTSAATKWATSKLPEKYRYGGDLKKTLSTAAAKLNIGMSEKSFKDQTWRERAKTATSSFLLGPTRTLLREAVKGSASAGAALKKVRGGGIDEEEKAVGNLSKEQQDLFMAAATDTQRAAILKSQAAKGKVDEKTFAAFKTADQKRDAMIKILEKMQNSGKAKEAGDIEKKMLINKDMLVAMQKKDATGFDAAAGKFYGGFSAGDWKSAAGAIGGKLYGDESPFHFLDEKDGDSVFNAIQPKLEEQILNPYNAALQNMAGGLRGTKAKKKFLKKMKEAIRNKVRSEDYDEDERETMAAKLKSAKMGSLLAGLGEDEEKDSGTSAGSTGAKTT